MPLLWKPSPKKVVPGESKELGEAGIRFYIRENKTYIIEDFPRTRKILYINANTESDRSRMKLRVFNVGLPWTYFLASSDRGFAIVFADRSLRSIHEPGCHDTPFPNTACEGGTFHICMGRRADSARSARSAYERFWNSTFNDEFSTECHDAYPEALVGKMERPFGWLKILARWEKLTAEGKAKDILWVPLFRNIDADLRRLYSLHAASECMQ